MSEPVAVILNPASNHGAGARIRQRVEAALSRRQVRYTLHVTEGPGHATQLAASLASGQGTAIVAVGGDGTVHEVANGLLQSSGEPPPLAIVPVGTGNDFYRMVGVPRSVEQAIDLLRHGRVRRFDVGRVRWSAHTRYFVNLLGIGVDTEVLRQRERFHRLPGLAQYLAALLVALARFRAVHLRIHIEGGETLAGEALIAAFTVGPSAGGGFLLTPDALPDDGKLDLCWVRRLTLPQIARYLPLVMRGRHTQLSEVHMRRLRCARVTSSGEPFRFEMDGELAGQSVAELEVELLPARLPVLTQPDAHTRRGVPTQRTSRGVSPVETG
ncbi:MAG: diacylglycerol kinase family lipid kinase [Gemmatimonadetes bacterium]|nr:diacylglycerol kinase family lipid kinase [Gemmatimonadota bacterium]